MEDLTTDGAVTEVFLLVVPPVRKDSVNGDASNEMPGLVVELTSALVPVDPYWVLVLVPSGKKTWQETRSGYKSRRASTGLKYSAVKSVMIDTV